MASVLSEDAHSDGIPVLTPSNSTCTHLVVDSGAFIRFVRIDRLGENLYTVPAVYGEVKDEQARNFLLNFPKPIKNQDPDPQSIQHIIEFAKKSGDFAVLSSTDIKILALTYSLEKQYNGTDHLRSEPVKTSLPYNQSFSQCAVVTGKEKKVNKEGEEQKEEEIEEEKDGSKESTNIVDTEQAQTEDHEEKFDEEEFDEEYEDEEEVGEEGEENGEEGEEGGKKITKDRIGFGSWEEDDDGWITSDNVHLAKAEMEEEDDEDKNKQGEPKIIVGCLTTDFAMQNVLLQMGLNVISIDGLRIQKVRQFVLWCKACFKIHHELDRMFCSRCGNYSLRRITCTVDKKTGELKLFFNMEMMRNPSIRGTRFSLPKPKGGRKGQKLILREDQLPPHKRRRRQPDYFNSDFGFLQPRRTQNSDDYKLGFGNARKNPNESKHRTGKKKKRNRKLGYRA